MKRKKDSAIISFLLFALLFIIIFALSIFIKKKAIIAEQPILLIKCEIKLYIHKLTPNLKFKEKGL